jgi:septal ring factor EnvC (AmiA/AmiB activator)
MLASIRPGRSATRELTRTALVLAMRRPRRLMTRMLLLALLLALAAAAGWLVRGGLPESLRPPAAPKVAPAPVDEPLRRELAQSHEELRLAQAHGAELERQIDALNQRLRETTEELTFFRKAREGRR